ncbi:hypothetical protein GA0074692_1910 [Micromonospora pallida]|uniref:DUF4350 domain-containing protein n=1 Tax=Micromonospora pallida TaxID=145854 RepID=A0A1C6S7C4_9ACTN|nr:hypothetical protein [Micromonospora pallida]SCL25178.1 hypothetical protein GA0074692_1910 [Micromonospora pallida]
MTERSTRHRLEQVRWVFLGVAVLVLVVFLLAQRQSVDVSYGRSPASAAVPEGSAGELSDATVPSTAEMTAMVAAAPVVRLPGSVAYWDEQRVREVIDDRDVRIIVAPPGLDKAERERVWDVEDVTVRVLGLEVSGGLYQASADDLTGWRAQFATGDVTNLLVTLIATLGKEPTPPDTDALRWRDPDAAELAEVTADLRATGLHVAQGATLSAVPDRTAATAFPDGDALYVALPRQRQGEPVARYGPALTGIFPDRPIVVLYGAWIEYHGPHGEEFAEVTGASFYGQFADRLSRYDYPQNNVLSAYLARVTDVRYTGLFDRPLPYRPVDPLRVALPALPWLFAGCVVVFLALSARSLWRGVGRAGTVVGRPGTTARLAGLTALAVEMSLLTDRRSDPGLTRGVTKLQAARSALDEGLPDQHVHALLADAEAELDDTARAMGVAGYRPALYLRERLA